MLRIGSFSGGHPYLLQLLGDNIYHIVEENYDPFGNMVIPVSSEILQQAEKRAFVEYKENVLDDVLRGTHRLTRAYLQAAHSLKDEHGLVSVSAINASFGKTAQELSSTRAAALNTQIIKVERRGYLRFTLPHNEYIFEHLAYEEPEAIDDEWEF